MRKWTALYYPDIEPPAGWLRSAALFFDSVTSFVPAESDEALSDELRKFADATDAWTPYRPTESTALLVDEVPVERLDQAFAAIAAGRKRTPGRIEFEILRSKEGKVRVKDHVFMHGSKLSLLVRKRLDDHRLMLPKGLSESFMEGDWWLVNEQASDLILSHIADTLAARRGWTSITDDEDCYAFTALDHGCAVAGPKSAEDELARILVTELVPQAIEALSIEKYIELRRRYTPIRERLAAFVDEVILEDRLSRIEDTEELRQAVRDSVKELEKEIQNFRESALGRTFRKWGPFSLGGFVTIAAALTSQPWALPLAGASVLFAALEKTGVFEPKVTKRGDMVRLVAAARKDIIRSIERF
jgi:hypothetical protein